MRELSLHILDILQNSLAAGATLVELVIEEDLPADRLTITIRDNGRGMTEEQLAHVTDPFFTTRKTRKIGLGIPLFKAAAERSNGDLTIMSQPGVGTTVAATFQHSNIDRAPLGDMVGTLLTVILNGACELRYGHRVVWGRRVDKETRRRGDEETSEFTLDTAEIKAELEDVPLTHPDVRRWLQAFIAEGEATLSNE
jgi:hypothetical protein